MKNFEVEIHFPGRKNVLDSEISPDNSAQEILAKFDSLNWRGLRILQLQMDGSNSTFFVKNQETGEYLNITLNAFSAGDALEFRLESNIAMMVPFKDLFGLITRQAKSVLAYKSIGLEQLTHYLTAFVQGENNQMKEYYMQLIQNKAAQANRAAA